MADQRFLEAQIDRLNESARRRDWRANDSLIDDLLDEIEENPGDGSVEYIVESLPRMEQIVRRNMLATFVGREGETAIRLAVKMFAYEMQITGWDGNCTLVEFEHKDPANEDYVNTTANAMIGYSDWSVSNISCLLPFLREGRPDERLAALIFLDCWMSMSSHHLSGEMLSLLVEADYGDDVIAEATRSKIVDTDWRRWNTPVDSECRTQPKPTRWRRLMRWSRLYPMTAFALICANIVSLVVILSNTGMIDMPSEWVAILQAPGEMVIYFVDAFTGSSVLAWIAFYLFMLVAYWLVGRILDGILGSVIWEMRKRRTKALVETLKESFENISKK